MPDDRDYSAEPPRRDRSGDPFHARREDDFDDSYSRRTVPALVRTAGIIWILFGALGLLGAASNLVLAAGADGGSRGGVGCGALIAIAFLYVGVQSVKGTAKDTLGNSIGSLCMGVLYGVIGAFVLVFGAAFSAAPAPAGGPAVAQGLAVVSIIIGGVCLLLAAGLILAGVLALMGRADYQAYRRAGKRSASYDD